MNKVEQIYVDYLRHVINYMMSDMSKDLKNNEKSCVEKKAKVTPESYKFNLLYIEKRSKRLQLLIQPSTHKKLKTLATKENSSVNDLINRILKTAVEGA